ncbi:MAG: hypothetical protein FWH27_03755, partial [Planctomycetaceae bacterium]|nr:hypothetical protein [Planctomycetaceae bacterium]
MTVRANEPDIPQRPKTLSYRYENNGDSLTLREKPHVIAACFLGFWLTGWTIGCVLLIWQVLKEPSFFCFATPFWAAWIFVFCQLMMVIFGKTTVLLDCDGLLSEYRVLIKISSRQVPIDEIRYCHAIEKNPAGNDSESSCFIEAVTHGKPVHFSTTRFEEAEWLACEMNQMLMALKGKEQWKAMPDLIEVEDQHETDEQVTILLTSKPQNIEPPGDCRWKMSVGFDSVTFRQQGEFSLGALGYTTFTMIFWNGIVSVFVMVLWGFQKGGPEFLSWGWWGMFLFLIPFEVIGLIFFLAWFLALMAPF